MDSKIPQYYIDRAAYVAFREDYRVRWGEPEADPVTAWNVCSEKRRWVAIARAVLESW